MINSNRYSKKKKIIKTRHHSHDGRRAAVVGDKLIRYRIQGGLIVIISESNDKPLKPQKRAQ